MCERFTLSSRSAACGLHTHTCSMHDCQGFPTLSNDICRSPHCPKPRAFERTGSTLGWPWFDAPRRRVASLRSREVPQNGPGAGVEVGGSGLFQSHGVYGVSEKKVSLRAEKKEGVRGFFQDPSAVENETPVWANEDDSMDRNACGPVKLEVISLHTFTVHQLSTPHLGRGFHQQHRQYLGPASQKRPNTYIHTIHIQL